MINTHERVALIDVLDKVLEKGAVINGDMVLRTSGRRPCISGFEAHSHFCCQG